MIPGAGPQPAYLDYLPLGAFLLRHDYVVLWWNKCLAEWTGRAAADMVDQDIRQAFPDLAQPGLEARLEQVFQAGAPAVFSSQLHHHLLPVPRQDGSLRRQHTVVTPVPQEGGQPNLALFCIQDVTDLTDLSLLYRQTRDSALREVEERKLAEERLLRAKEASELILRVVPSAIFMVDKNRRITAWNARAEELTGYSAQEAIGSLCTEFALTPCLTDCGLLDPSMPKPILEMECSIRRKDGEVRLLSKNVEAVLDAQGNLAGGIESFEDITEQQQAQDALVKSEERYRVLVENAANIILRMDPRGVITFFNKYAEELFGFTRQEIVGRDIVGTIVPQTDSAGRDLRAMIRDIGGRPDLYETNENENLLRDGRRIWVRWTNKAVLGPNGQVSEILCIGNDITERRQAEEQLRKLSLAVEQSPASVVITNTRGDIEYVNPKFCQASGFSRQEALGQNPRVLKSGLMEPEVYRGLWEAISTTGEWRGELLNRRRNGELYWEHASISAVRDAQGVVTHYVAVKEDVTERKAAEEKLRQSEESYRRQFYDNSTVMLLVDPAEGRIVDANRAAERFYGYSHDQFLGLRISDLNTLPLEELRQIMAAIPQDQGAQFEFQHLLADGSTRMVEVSSSLVSVRGRPLLHSIIHDITERKRAEAELLETNRRLETATAQARELAWQAEQANQAKSEFLANMSHEIRTPMNGIIGMTEVLMDSGLSPEQRESLGLVASSARALLTVINDILDFSKIEAGKLTLESTGLDLTALLDESLALVAGPAEEKGLALAQVPDPGLPRHFLGDPVRLKQVLVNLLSNAVKFTGQGHVLVEARALENLGQSMRLHFSVSDTGLGISPDKQALIFQAFEQADMGVTRRFGGTGLGLAICAQLVELMGGRIQVESSPGQGSSFSFTAVLGLAPPGPADPGRRRARQALAGRRVLVATAQPVVAEGLRRLLTGWGLEVLSERQADQAGGLAGLADLALVDLDLPWERVSALLAALRAGRPGGSALVTLVSSNRRMAQAGQSRELGAAAWVSKPVGQDALLRALAGALDPGSAQALDGPEASPSAGAGPSAGLRILVAEDNPVNQMVARHLLERWGHQVEVVDNGQRAVELSSRKAFDLALMDVQMPVLDGLSATQAIREREGRQGGHLMILAMTAHAMKGDKERCLEAGMDGYVAKPIDPQELRAALERATAGVSPGQAAQEPPVVDGQRLGARFGHDQALTRRLIAIFLEDYPPNLDLAARALAAGQAPELAEAAHTIKGSVAYFEAPEAWQAAKDLEDLARAGSLDQAGPAWERLRNKLSLVERDLRGLLEEPPS